MAGLAATQKMGAEKSDIGGGGESRKQSEREHR